MSRAFVFGGGALALLLAVAGWRIHESSRPPEIPFETENRPPAPVPLCPWREPASDLKLFFPNATGYKVETRILSGLRLELAARLGRAPTGDENALRVYSVYQEQTPLGVVLTRRVKGELGAIEVVVAVNTNQEICGVRLQRLRETEASAAALQNSEWLRSFVGKRADSSWQMGKDFPDVPAEARVSAEAIVDGVRSSLILLATESGTHDMRGHGLRWQGGSRDTAVGRTKSALAGENFCARESGVALRFPPQSVTSPAVRQFNSRWALHNC